MRTYLPRVKRRHYRLEGKSPALFLLPPVPVGRISEVSRACNVRAVLPSSMRTVILSIHPDGCPHGIKVLVFDQHPNSLLLAGRELDSASESQVVRDIGTTWGWLFGFALLVPAGYLISEAFVLLR